MDIKINNLTKKIKESVVLDNINLHMTSGKVYGLCGKNGSGKTMLMRALCGLIYPTSGEIILDDKILHKDISFPGNIGILIENPAFIPSYTAYENLKMLGSIKGGYNDEQIREALKSTGLDPDDKRTYKKYSLGMKQKLGIANAVIGQPDIIILDEPLNALDSESVVFIENILEKEKQRGSVIIIACHDKEELDKLSDCKIFIENGRITEIIEREI